jgi:hypothetical protein
MSAHRRQHHNPEIVVEYASLYYVLEPAIRCVYTRQNCLVRSSAPLPNIAKLSRRIMGHDCLYLRDFTER